LAATGLTDEEFQTLLPTFEKGYQLSSKPKPKAPKKHKQRAQGGGRKAKLADASDKLLFVLIYQKNLSVANHARLTIWFEPTANQLLDSSAVAWLAANFS
jgi:hypothetical protein